MVIIIPKNLRIYSYIQCTCNLDKSIKEDHYVMVQDGGKNSVNIDPLHLCNSGFQFNLRQNLTSL
jgi:hypothetical protein